MALKATIFKADLSISDMTRKAPTAWRITPAKIEAIAAETLVDQLVFSIDGAREETYSRYRVGGKLARALDALERSVEACRRYGTDERVGLLWQYILFQ